VERAPGAALYIFVPGSRALRITDAPLGPDVVTAAQRDGELEFMGKDGLGGTVNLSDNTATLSTGEVIEATERPYVEAN
jgi:hypothetical protein